MIRQLLSLLCLAMASCVGPGEDSSEQLMESGNLTIYSTTDREAFKPVISDFTRLHPRVTIEYVEVEAAPLYERFLREAAAGTPKADLLLSSAIDLQVKLVNDGFAAPHRSENALRLPTWAQWRNEAFGFTFEPAVMVFNNRLIAKHAMPRSRPALIQAISNDPAFWRRRIGTYDVLTSSVGYLLASQDARHSGEFAALIDRFRDVQVQSFDTTSDLLQRIETGELVMGYNLLGSYARARVAAGAPITIVYPEDYTLVVARTAVLPKDAPHPRAAHLFVEYLLSLRGQMVLANRTGLSAVRQEIQGPYSRLGIAEATVGPLRPIGLGPGLLVYLDQQKRTRLLSSWGGEERPR